jgi:hypothetical protein
MKKSKTCMAFEVLYPAYKEKMEADGKQKLPGKPESSEDNAKPLPDTQHNLDRSFLYINLQIAMST